MSEWFDHEESVVEVAWQAGEEILQIYHSKKFDEQIERKDDNSPLTQADMVAHSVIERELNQLDPEIPVISEESSSIISHAERQAFQRHWLVDPLDGTKEFLKRNGEFTVNIALIEGGFPVWGVIYAPTQEVTYLGNQKTGAARILGRDRASKQPISSQTFNQGDDRKEIKFIVSRSHTEEIVERYLSSVQAQLQEASEFQIHSFQRISRGSSLKFCALAEGEAELYPRFGPTSEWDTAAGQAIVESAGGVVVNFFGERFRYNDKESLLNPSFIALSDPQLIPIALSALHGSRKKDA